MFCMQVYAQHSAHLKDMAAFRNDIVLQWHKTQHEELEARRCSLSLSCHLLYARCHAAHALSSQTLTYNSLYRKSAMSNLRCKPLHVAERGRGSRGWLY